ncbi:hypothetical protein Q7C36_019150 [Tachysurus vachellii]|uniref:Uncharacterized protein n=1 Tax=Tachysurus vachellii TaxID=175792 RepID=A0AA88LVV5_TACVA|nr:hypothetical protein Q7C36_019150 [Tachysurus vachellii]
MRSAQGKANYCITDSGHSFILIKEPGEEELSTEVLHDWGKEGTSLYRPAPLSGVKSCLAATTEVELLDELHLH